LEDVQAPGGERLSLRVGIGAGDMVGVSLGGVLGRWELVVMGPAVSEATAAAAAGEPGAVMLGPSARGALVSRCPGLDASADLSRITTPKPLPPRSLDRPRPAVEAVPALVAHIPAAVHRRLAATHSAWLAELRRLTVLFVNLPGLGAGGGLEMAQEVVTALQSELYR